jgi:DNA invertase Pin-like site-specific DNA recombinase
MTEIPAPVRSFGHARVSTVGQILEAQLTQLTEAGCAMIYREEVSGAKAGRRELARLLKALQSGDEVAVTHIDRLARSTFDLFGIVKRIVDAGRGSVRLLNRGRFQQQRQIFGDAKRSSSPSAGALPPPGIWYGVV